MHLTGTHTYADLYCILYMYLVRYSTVWSIAQGDLFRIILLFCFCDQYSLSFAIFAKFVRNLGRKKRNNEKKFGWPQPETLAQGNSRLDSHLPDTEH